MLFTLFTFDIKCNIVYINKKLSYYGMKFLIVDDNTDITKMFSKYLTMKGYECTISNNGQSGLSLIKNQQFDYIILDIAMPDFSGLDVINSLEKENILKDKKILVLTASSISNEKIEELTQKNGIISVLKKPVQMQELLSIVSK